MKSAGEIIGWALAVGFGLGCILTASAFSDYGLDAIRYIPAYFFMSFLLTGMLGLMYWSHQRER